MSRVQTGSTACTFPYKRLGCSCLRLASSFILDCSCSIVFHQFLCVHRSRRCPDLIYNMHLAIRALGLFLSPSSHVLDCPFRFVVFRRRSSVRHRVPVRTTVPVSVVSSLFLYHESWVFPPAFCSAPLHAPYRSTVSSRVISTCLSSASLSSDLFPPLRKCPHPVRLSCYFLDLDLINSRTPIWTLSFHYCYILTGIPFMCN